MPIRINASTSISEADLEFRFTRSTGPGGQNVNKVASRVELLFNVRASASLNEIEKGRIFAALGSRIDSEGILHVSSQESRSQWKNRDIAIAKLTDLLHDALRVRKKRIATKPSSGSREARVKTKKTHSAKKKLRGKVRTSDE